MAGGGVEVDHPGPFHSVAIPFSRKTNSAGLVNLGRKAVLISMKQQTGLSDLCCCCPSHFLDSCLCLGHLVSEGLRFATVKMSQKSVQTACQTTSRGLLHICAAFRHGFSQP